MIPLPLARAHAGAGHVRSAVIKARDPYFDELSRQISSAIIAAQGDIAAKHVQDLLASLDMGEIGFSRAMAILCNGFRDELGPAITDDVTNRVLLAYTRGTVDVIGTTRFELNMADEKALDWMSRDVRYWVGDYWSPELAAEISQTLAPAFAQGITGQALGERMRDVLADRFTRSDAYWRMFATNVTTRSRAFGTTEGALRAGFRVGRIDAIMDSVTSPICRLLDGKVVQVQDMAAQRDAIVAAEPAQIKEIAPWPDAEQVVAAGNLIAALGVVPQAYSQPPYHGHCRSVIVFE